MAKRITEIPKLPKRQADAHKGNFGRVLVVAGSQGMIGASALAANAALRSGGGLVRVAVPRKIQLTVAGLVPCATTLPLSEDEDGNISVDADGEVLDALSMCDVLAIGPGMGNSSGLQTLLRKIISEFSGPMVIDADGLNNLANGEKIIFNRQNHPTVLTPHPGEMARLWRCYFRENMPDDRCEQAQRLAIESGTVVVLKGNQTVVTDGTRTYINSTGNPGMATGGSGDVLTGCIAGLLGHKEAGLSLLDAAILGVYTHGRAGDMAADALSQTGLIATDLLKYLAKAWEI
ncbi:MAG: NAD(P)H-hydrate dehydratase [Phycisphaerae bacterium]|nr:NAD(P)H-hydrate dehydratase [Phycisphaerae bacterium]